MGQVLSSCAPCCSGAQAYEDVDSYQKVSDIGTNDNNQAKDVKFLKKLEKTLKKHPKISDEEWQKIATKSWKKINKRIVQ